VNEYGEAMKKINWLVFLLIFLCVSCASTGNMRDRSQSTASDTEELTDTATCAYFYYLWAKSAENNNRFEEALHAYEKVLVCDPETDYVTRDLAILLIRMGRKQQAVEWLGRIISRHPSDIDNRRLLAKLYTNLGETEKAIEAYKEILRIEEDQQTLLMLGSLYARDGQYDKAQESLERLLRLDQNSYMGHYYLARLYRELKFYDKALASYEKALDITWSSILAFEVAELYEQEGKFAKAAELYQQILEEDDTNERARTHLINVYLKTDQVNLALEELMELRNFASDPELVDYTISRLLMTQERFDDAIETLSAMLEEDNEKYAARYLLALALHRKNETEEAKKQLRLIPPTAKEYEEGILLLVRILQEDKDIEGAIKILKEEISAEATKKMSFYVMLASLYEASDNIDKAKEVFEQARKEYSDSTDLLFEYGVFLERIGDQQGALAKMQELLVMEPDNAPALNYIGYTWADNNENLDQALKYIVQAVALKPEDGFIRDSLGWVYYRMGNIEQAVVELEKALELVDTDPVIYEHMGDAYLKANEFQKARIAYEKAYELYEKEDKKSEVGLKIERLKSRE